MARAMASPRTQPALMTYRLAGPSTCSIAVGLLEGTKSVHTLPARVLRLTGMREWDLAHPDEQ